MRAGKTGWRPREGEATGGLRGEGGAVFGAVAVLAAHANAGIQRQVVADHAHPLQRLGAVADDGGALHRVCLLYTSDAADE